MSPEKSEKSILPGVLLVGAGALTVFAAFKIFSGEKEKEELPPPSPGPVPDSYLDPKTPKAFAAPAVGTFDIVQVYDQGTRSWVGAPQPLPVDRAAFDVVNSSSPEQYKATYPQIAKSQHCDQLPSVLTNPSQVVYRWLTQDGVLSRWAAVYSNCSDGRYVSTAASSAFTTTAQVLGPGKKKQIMKPNAIVHLSLVGELPQASTPKTVMSVVKGLPQVPSKLARSVVGEPVSRALGENKSLAKSLVAGTLDTDDSGVSTAYGLLSTVSMAASAYHGYKRNNSVGWALGWGFLGAAFPVITPVIAIAQGFAQPAKKLAVGR